MLIQDLPTSQPYLAAASDEPNLVIEETQSGIAFLFLVTMTTLLALLILTVFILLRDSTSPTFSSFVFLCYVYYGWFLLSRRLCRYRLRKHRHSVKFLSIPPMSEYKLLHHVAASPDLMRMLTPSNRLPEGFPALTMMRSLQGLGVAAFLVLAGMMVYRGTITPILVLQAASVIPIVLFSQCAIARMRPGFALFGSGSSSPSDSVQTPAKFEEVRSVTIKWDYLLGQMYLSLEADGESTRYYNPTDDSLYLLRLIKHRMADSELVVSPIRS